MQRLLTRLKSALAWFREAGSPIDWRLIKAQCPNCHGNWFLALRKDAFMTRCLRCRATVIALAPIPILTERIDEAASVEIWEMSTYGPVVEFLRRCGAQLTETEYIEGYPSGEIVNGILIQDAQSTTFPANSFDFITSNCVFEHVYDDKKAFRECFRVLKPGGALVFTVPYHEKTSTERIADLVNGKLAFLNGKPEFHSSRITGPQSVPTFWHHSLSDIKDRLQSCGFSPSIVRVKLNQSSSMQYDVIVAEKSL